LNKAVCSQDGLGGHFKTKLKKGEKMKIGVITMLTSLLIGATAFGVEVRTVLFQKATVSSGGSDFFNVQCLEDVQFGTGQSTRFRDALNVSLSEEGADQLKLLNKKSKAVDYYMRGGRSTPMALNDCEKTKDRVFTYSFSEAIQVVISPLSELGLEDRCSVQIRTRLSMAPLGFVGNNFVELEKRLSSSLLFGTYDAVQVMPFTCDKLKSIEDPRLAKIRGQVDEFIKN